MHGIRVGYAIQLGQPAPECFVTVNFQSRLGISAGPIPHQEPISAQQLRHELNLLRLGAPRAVYE